MKPKRERLLRPGDFDYGHICYYDARRRHEYPDPPRPRKVAHV